MAAGVRGFVLVGGRSSRMGRDKALLPRNGSTLVDHVAGCVRLATGNVTLIGPRQRYAALGYPLIEDAVRNCGPLGGVFTALKAVQDDWALIVACDMPNLTVDFLADLLRFHKTSVVDCIVPQTAVGIDPLCALYHRRCAASANSAIQRKSFKMQDFVSSLNTVTWRVDDPSPLANINTPEEWSAL